MSIRTWSLFITLVILAAAVLIPLLTDSSHRNDLELLCNSFSDSGSLPLHKDICSLLEKVKLCRNILNGNTLSCGIHE